MLVCGSMLKHRDMDSWDTQKVSEWGKSFRPGH